VEVRRYPPTPRTTLPPEGLQGWIDAADTIGDGLASFEHLFAHARLPLLRGRRSFGNLCPPPQSYGNLARPELPGSQFVDLFAWNTICS
jgi:hypothetical protein